MVCPMDWAEAVAARERRTASRSDHISAAALQAGTLQRCRPGTL